MLLLGQKVGDERSFAVTGLQRMQSSQSQADPERVFRDVFVGVNVHSNIVAFNRSRRYWTLCFWIETRLYSGQEAPMAARKNDEQRVDQILEKHELKKTALRKRLITAFMDAKGSMSQGDVIGALEKEQDVDRVSVYRNLLQLKEAGVLHEIEANTYVFCSHECEQHAHLLLFCQSCHRHQEIKDHERIDHLMDTLKAFRFFSVNRPLFLRGVCAGCGGN